MARRARNIEFLESLREMSGLDTDSAFAKACGKHQPAIANALAGRPVPGKRFLLSGVEHLFGWGISPIMEIEPLPGNLNTLPKDSGIYVIYGSGAEVLYIGQASNFRTEVRQTLNRPIPVGLRIGPALRRSRPAIRTIATHLSLYAVASERVRHNLEALLLRVFINHTHNTNIGRFR